MQQSTFENPIFYFGLDNASYEKYAHIKKCVKINLHTRIDNPKHFLYNLEPAFSGIITRYITHA